MIPLLILFSGLVMFDKSFSNDYSNCAIIAVRW